MSRAFGNVTEKVGKKGQMGPTKIPDVETFQCPRGKGQPHQIENTATAISRCRWCKKTWAELDEEVRQAARAAQRARRRGGDDV